MTNPSRAHWHSETTWLITTEAQLAVRDALHKLTAAQNWKKRPPLKSQSTRPCPLAFHAMLDNKGTALLALNIKFDLPNSSPSSHHMPKSHPLVIPPLQTFRNRIAQARTLLLSAESLAALCTLDTFAHLGVLRDRVHRVVHLLEQAVHVVAQHQATPAHRQASPCPIEQGTANEEAQLFPVQRAHEVAFFPVATHVANHVLSPCVPAHVRLVVSVARDASNLVLSANVSSSRDKAEHEWHAYAPIEGLNDCFQAAAAALSCCVQLLRKMDELLAAHAFFFSK